MDTAADTLVLELADISQVVAVSSRTQKPENSMQWARASQVKGLSSSNAETIYRERPDLVFFGPWTALSTRELLSGAGVEIQRLKSTSSWEDVYANIRTVGALVGKPERAESMIAEMQERLDAVRIRVAGHPKRSGLCYLGRGSTYGQQSKMNFVFESAGVINIPAERGIVGLGKMSVEELILSKPDLIVFSDYHKSTPTLGRQVLDHPVFRGLQQRLKEVELPASKMNGTDCYLVDCVETLARAAYPEAFAETELAGQ